MSSFCPRCGIWSEHTHCLKCGVLLYNSGIFMPGKEKYEPLINPFIIHDEQYEQHKMAEIIKAGVFEVGQPMWRGDDWNLDDEASQIKKVPLKKLPVQNIPKQIEQKKPENQKPEKPKLNYTALRAYRKLMLPVWLYQGRIERWMLTLDISKRTFRQFLHEQGVNVEARIELIIGMKFGYDRAEDLEDEFNKAVIHEETCKENADEAAKG